MTTLALTAALTIFTPINPCDLADPSAYAPLAPTTETVALVELWRFCHPDPEPEPAPAPVVYSKPKPKPPAWSGSVEDWRSLVASYFAPTDVETALCIMGYESRGNPNAKNPRSSASGLFQLLKTWHDYFNIDPFDPAQNVSAAARLKGLYGWTQWSPYNAGKCHGL